MAFRALLLVRWTSYFVHLNIIILRTYECAQKTVWESWEIDRMSYTNYRRRARRPMTNACPILIRHYSRVPADPAGTAPDRATCATRPPGAVAGSSARPAQTARVAQRGTLLIYLAVYKLRHCRVPCLQVPSRQRVQVLQRWERTKITFS